MVEDLIVIKDKDLLLIDNNNMNINKFLNNKINKTIINKETNKDIQEDQIQIIVIAINTNHFGDLKFCNILCS